MGEIHSPIPAACLGILRGKILARDLFERVGLQTAFSRFSHRKRNGIARRSVATQSPSLAACAIINSHVLVNDHLQTVARYGSATSFNLPFMHQIKRGYIKSGNGS